jgi:hypothetical protein
MNSSVRTITDSCTYSGSGNWNMIYSHNCAITSSINLGANYLILTGNNGSITIKNGGKIAARGVYMTPTILRQDSRFVIEMGGRLNVSKP